MTGFFPVFWFSFGPLSNTLTGCLSSQKRGPIQLLLLLKKHVIYSLKPRSVSLFDMGDNKRTDGFGLCFDVGSCEIKS